MNVQAYVGLGGNIGDSVGVLNQALEEIGKIPGVWNLQCSDFYQTSPVGYLEQNDFVNAVCRFKTSLSIKELHKELRRIENSMGNVLRPKDHPRVLDLDLIFFGSESYDDGNLRVPHRAWEDRLFVLLPLANLTPVVNVPKGGIASKIDLLKMIKTFPNKHQETVTFLTKPKDEKVHI
jgi:2-amino-4-hydroxy-6-hydroxymethyldihydropteridine diphosphokinase